jgi:lipopolysaccharide assembly outer membrane protein LptD (OstA)
MKRLVLSSCIAMLALAQTPVRRGEIKITAAYQEKDGAIRHLTGQVTVETEAVIIQASQADINQDTGEIRSHGDVTIKLK